jgi:4-diphosphocytidyl-2-C-methyl-D-erythritol kinase
VALSSAAPKRRRITLTAAAKVNLALEILGKRDDGYHEIVTVMVAVDLSDRLTLEDADALTLDSDAPGVPTDATNLAVRAAAALRDEARTDRGVRITLDKRIPVAAGLGGGSSDAAAVLVGLNRLWSLRWPLDRLVEIATGIGMDVPFFLRGGAALATARGEKLQSIGSRAFGMVLLNPGSPISTKEAYGSVTPRLYSAGARAHEIARAMGSRQPAAIAGCLYNVLEDAVTPGHPEVARMRAATIAAGALGAVMSGSGPTMVGVARSFDHARQLRTRLTRPSWSCWAVRALTGPAVRMRTGEA